MIKAMRECLLVEPIYTEKVGSVLIPQTGGRFKQYHGYIYGLVVAVGAEYKWRDQVRPGDKILFRRHEGKPVKVNGKNLLSISEPWADAVIR